MAAKYAFYAHLDAPVYEHLDGISRKFNQSKSFIVSEALKRLDVRTIQPNPKQAVSVSSKPASQWSIQEPVSFFTSR